MTGVQGLPPLSFDRPPSFLDGSAEAGGEIIDRAPAGVLDALLHARMAWRTRGYPPFRSPEHIGEAALRIEMIDQCRGDDKAIQRTILAKWMLGEMGLAGFAPVAIIAPIARRSTVSLVLLR
jgi:hypothetical protein